MPRRKYVDENVEFPNAYSQRNLLHDPITLHIMKEMDVVPLNPSQCVVEDSSEEKKTSPIKPLQMVNGTKRRMLVIPETNTHFKAYRDDFVLCQKFPTNTSSGENHFSRLSDEIILQIFEWLPKTTLIKCAVVCKRWKTLSYDESLWTRFNLGKKHVDSGVLNILLQRGVCALRLAMSEIQSPVFIKDSAFANRQSFSKLQYLDLSMAILSPVALADILAVCNRLKKLSLEACVLNEDCCKFIAKNKALEVLNMVMCSGLTPIGLREIAINCKNLKEWNLAWTRLNDCCLKAFLPVLPNTLIRLNISGHREEFDDTDLLNIANRCCNLIELDISDCHLVTEASFIPLIRTCSKLEHLHTSRAYKISTHCYQYLKQLKHFKHLEIFRTLTDEALACLRKFLPEIKINTKVFSTIARPTTGNRRTAIWGLKVKDIDSEDNL